MSNALCHTGREESLHSFKITPLNLKFQMHKMDSRAIRFFFSSVLGLLWLAMVTAYSISNRSLRRQTAMITARDLMCPK